MPRFLFGLAATGLSAILLWQLIDWDLAWGSLRGADPLFIGLAVSCLVVSAMVKTVRWRFLLPGSSPVTTVRLYRILHISFLLNNVLPVRLGDVARVTLAARQPGLRIGHVLSSLLTERVTDAVTLLLGFVLVSPLLPLPERYEAWLQMVWFFLAGFVALAVVGALFHRPLQGLWAHMRTPLPVPGFLRAEATSFGEGWRQLFARGLALKIWGLSWVAWLPAFAINYLLMRALGIEAPIAVAVLLTCTTNIAMLLPSSPGYFGVFHAAATLSLLPFNVPASSALAFAILAHLVNVVPVSVIGAAFLLLGREQLHWRRGGSGGVTLVADEV